MFGNQRRVIQQEEYLFPDSQRSLLDFKILDAENKEDVKFKNFTNYIYYNLPIPKTEDYKIYLEAQKKNEVCLFHDGS